MDSTNPPAFNQSDAQRDHRQTVHDMESSLDPHVIGNAFMRVINPANAPLYKATEERSRWWPFFTAMLNVPDMTMTVTYFKKDGVVRTILARMVYQDYPTTYRYLTVWDMEYSGFRRVNLEGIIKVTVESHSSLPY